jgi:hypothetical protein
MPKRKLERRRYRAVWFWGFPPLRPSNAFIAFSDALTAVTEPFAAKSVVRDALAGISDIHDFALQTPPSVQLAGEFCSALLDEIGHSLWPTDRCWRPRRNYLRPSQLFGMPSPALQTMIDPGASVSSGWRRRFCTCLSSAGINGDSMERELPRQRTDEGAGT